MAQYPWEKSYPAGVKWELDIPKKTIHQIFEESCVQYANKPFTDFLDKVMTFADYREASDHAAAGFQKLGVGPGVNVGLYLPNTPHYLIAFFGVLKAGGRVVNYSPLDAARELEFKIGDSETDILVTLDVTALYPKMAAHARQDAAQEADRRARSQTTCRGPRTGSIRSPRRRTSRPGRATTGTCPSRTCSTTTAPISPIPSRATCGTRSRSCSTPAARPACRRPRC